MTWFLRYEHYAAAEERLREVLCALGNGYFVTRASAPESKANDIYYPGTYLAGGYNRLKTQLAGHTIENEDLVNLPNWLSLSFRIDGGPWFCLEDVEILSFQQELEIERGLLRRSFRFRDGRGLSTRVFERRLVALHQPHLAALETAISAEDWFGTLDIRTALDGEVTNSGVERYRLLVGRRCQSQWGSRKIPRQRR